MTDHRPPKRLLYAFGGLLCLLALTTLLAFQPFGALNFPIALLIAACKIAIIAEVFMELSAARPVAIAFACTGFLWLMLLGWLSWLDYATRSNFPPHL